MKNREIAEKLYSFHQQEEKLLLRARAAGVDLSQPRFANWPLWVGDSAIYLNELRNEVEIKEAILKKAQG